MLGGSWRSGEPTWQCRPEKGRRRLEFDLGSGRASAGLGAWRRRSQVIGDALSRPGERVGAAGRTRG